MAKKKRKGGGVKYPRAYEIVRQPGPKNQPWRRKDNPWFDPMFTGVKITTPYDNLPKPLDPSFWDNVVAQSQQAKAPSEYDLALQTVRNMKTHKISYGNLSTENVAKDKGILSEGWSAFNWTMDKLARPMYGVENVVLHNMRDMKKDAKDGLSGGELLKNLLKMTPVGMATSPVDFAKGFTKDEKVSGQKIAKAAGIDNKWGKAALGFGIDVGLDPLTYIPGGALVKLFKGGGQLAKGGKAAKAAKDIVETTGDRLPMSGGSQANLFGGFEPLEHTVARARPVEDVSKVPDWAKKFNVGQGALLTAKGAPKFGKEATASATVARKIQAARAKAENVGNVPAYPGKTLAYKAGQKLFDPDTEKAIPSKAFIHAIEQRTGKSWKSLTKDERSKAIGEMSDSLKVRTNTKAWRAQLKKNGVDDDMLDDVEDMLGHKAASAEEVARVLKARIAARNVLAEGDMAQSAAASRPAAEIIQDANQGDLFANLAVDSAGNPLKSMAGNANTTGGGNVPIRKIEDLTEIERDIAHGAMNKHGLKDMTPIEQADLVKHIREEAWAVKKRMGKSTPKEVNDIIYSATNAAKIARAAMERFAREGKFPKSKDGKDWNILDIADMIGGRQGFEKLFGVKLKKGDVAWLHTLSKYASQTAKHLDGKGPLPEAVQGKPGFINAVRQMQNAGEAATSMKEAKIMQPILEDVARAAQEVTARGGSSAQAAEAISKRVAAGEKVLQANGMSDEGLKTFRSAAGAMKFPDTPEGKVFLDRSNAIATGLIKGDPADASMRHTMDDLTTELNGGMNEKDILNEQVHDITSRAVEHGIFSRAAALFNPRTGSKSVHTAMQRNVSWRQDETNIFRSFLSNLQKTYGPEKLREAQTLLRSGERWQENPAAVAIKKMWDDTTRAAGLSENAVAGQSTALRAAEDMAAVNRELRRQGSKFQMTNYAYDALNRKIDLSEGSRWLESAQYHNADDVVDHMSHVRAAIEQVAVERSFMHDVGKNFGSLTRTGEHTHKIVGPGTESIAGHYFPKEIAEQMSNALRKLEEIRQPHGDGRKLLEESMGAYKTVFTILNPRHHVVNNIGNTFLNWMAGVNDPRVYYKAASVSNYANSMIKDLDNITDVLGEGAYARSMARDIDSHKFLLKSKGKNGTSMNVQQFFLAAKEKGIIIGAHSAEDIGLTGKTWISRVPVLRKGEKIGRIISEQTENHSRYALFIDILQKHTGPITDDVLNNAAAKVRKWHPDGTDLTAFEKKYMRLVFPFYSWTRKAVPLMIEGIVYNPKKLVAIPKAQAAIATMMGFDPGTFADPFPADQAFPPWIRESGIGPTFAPGLDLPGLPKFSGYGVGSSNVLPPTAIAELFSGSKKTAALGVASQVSPLFRSPVELGLEHQAFGDKEIKDKSAYLSQNIPGLAQYTQISGRDPLGGNEPFGSGYYREQETGSAFSPTGLANWMTGVGLKDTGPYEKMATPAEQVLAHKKRREQNKNA